MKKLIAVFVVACALLAQGAFAKDKIVVGVSIPTADHGWMGGGNWWAQKAISDWKAKDKNVEFLFVTADSVNKQAADIEDLMVKGIDALVCFPVDPSITSTVEKAYKKGIYVVVLDRGVTKPVYDVYLSNDDEGYARTAMEWIAKELNYKGNIVLIEGIPCAINTTRVEQAKAIAAKYPGMKILDSQPGNWNQQKALEVMENYLQKYPQIDAVYTADDDMLKGALQAYKESGRKDIKVFLGGACSKEMVKKIIDGDPLVKADVTYPPDVVATAVSLAVMGVRGQTLEGFYQMKMPVRIILAAELVTKENAQSYYHPDSVF